MTATATAAARTSAVKAPDPDDGHKWVGAATVALTVAQAKRADLRGSIRVVEQTRIDVLDTYCKACRRPFEDVAGVRCAAITDPELFHGGPLGTRAKRTGHTVPGHSCVELGCNTGLALAAAQAARRNGVATDVRESRPVPANAKAQPPASPVPVTRRPRTAAVRLASVPVLSPDEEARLAARILASRRGQRRERNPLALTLW